MQTLYTNGTILTMEHPEDKPEALLVEDGRIARAGFGKRAAHIVPRQLRTG